jgi:hypothetical protein
MRMLVTANEQRCSCHCCIHNMGTPQEAVDRDVVAGAWCALLPGLLERYDSHLSLPCIAPRPLLIVNGADDPRCPVQGLCAPVAVCREAYEAHGAGGSFACHIEEGAGHEVTDRMDCVVEEFFLWALRPQGWRATLRRLAASGPGLALRTRPPRRWLPWQRRGAAHLVQHDVAHGLHSGSLDRGVASGDVDAGGTAEGAKQPPLRRLSRRPSYKLYEGLQASSVVPV